MKKVFFLRIFSAILLSFCAKHKSYENKIESVQNQAEHENKKNSYDFIAGKTKEAFKIYLTQSTENPSNKDLRLAAAQGVNDPSLSETLSSNELEDVANIIIKDQQAASTLEMLEGKDAASSSSYFMTAGFIFVAAAEQQQVPVMVPTKL